jgi:protein-tyrosine phosphatase
MNDVPASSGDNTGLARGRRRPWKLAVLWLAALVVLFHLSYGFAGWLAEQRSELDAVVFRWERYVPFFAWTVVPYLSIIAFYGMSTLICSTQGELTAHGRRLLTAHLLAGAVFAIRPLPLTFQQPEIAELLGPILALPASIGTQFNQAISLHTALLIVLYVLYARHVPRRARPALAVWFALAGAAAMTAYQHHFLGIPTGALLGWFCVWLWPEAAPSPLTGFSWSHDRRRWQVAMYYGVGAAVAASLALWMGDAGLWLLWPACSLLMVAAFYAGIGERGFQKRADGRMSSAAQWLLAPYLLGAWINSRLWTRSHPAPTNVLDQVWLGRFPSRDELRSIDARCIIDLTAELPAHGPSCPWHCVPMLDLVSPPARALREAAEQIQRCRENGPVLVCCALGYGRSAAALATWLLRSHRVASIEAAVALLRQARPQLVLHATDLHEIALAANDGPSSAEASSTQREPAA